MKGWNSSSGLTPDPTLCCFPKVAYLTKTVTQYHELVQTIEFDLHAVTGRLVFQSMFLQGSTQACFWGSTMWYIFLHACI